MSENQLTEVQLQNIISSEEETDSENKSLESTLKTAIQTGVDSDIKDLVNETLEGADADDLITKMLDPKQNYLKEFCGMLPEGMQESLTNRLRSYVSQVITDKLTNLKETEGIEAEKLDKLKKYFAAKIDTDVSETLDSADTSALESIDLNPPIEQAEAPQDASAKASDSSSAAQSSGDNTAGSASQSTTINAEDVDAAESTESEEFVFELAKVDITGNIDLATLDSIQYVHRSGIATFGRDQENLSAIWSQLDETQKKAIYAKLADHIVSKGKLKGLEIESGTICTEFLAHLKAEPSNLIPAEQKVYLAIMHGVETKLQTSDTELSKELRNLEITGLNIATFSLTGIPIDNKAKPYLHLPTKKVAAQISLQISANGSDINYADLTNKQINENKTELDTAYRQAFEAAFNTALTNLNAGGGTPNRINPEQFKGIVDSIITDSNYSVDNDSVKNALHNVDGTNREYMRQLYLGTAGSSFLGVKFNKPTTQLLDSNTTAQLILAKTDVDFDINGLEEDIATTALNKADLSKLDRDDTLALIKKANVANITDKPKIGEILNKVIFVTISDTGLHPDINTLIKASAASELQQKVYISQISKAPNHKALNFSASNISTFVDSIADLDSVFIVSDKLTLDDFVPTNDLDNLYLLVEELFKKGLDFCNAFDFDGVDDVDKNVLKNHVLNRFKTNKYKTADTVNQKLARLIFTDELGAETDANKYVDGAIDDHFSNTLALTQLNNLHTLVTDVPKKPELVKTNAKIQELINTNLGSTLNELIAVKDAMAPNHLSVLKHYDLCPPYFTGEMYVKEFIVSYLADNTRRTTATVEKTNPLIRDAKNKYAALRTKLEANQTTLDRNDQDMQIAALLVLKDAGDSTNLTLNQAGELDLSSVKAAIITKIQGLKVDQVNKYATNFGSYKTYSARSAVMRTQDGVELRIKADDCVEPHLEDFVRELSNLSGDSSERIIEVQDTLDNLLIAGNGGLSDDEKTAFAIYYNMKEDVGSEKFEKSLRAKLEALAMEETGLDLEDDTYEDISYRKESMGETFKRSLFKDILSEYSDRDLHDPEARNAIINEVSNRMMEERLRIIEERMSETRALDWFSKAGSGTLNLFKKAGLPALATYLLGNLFVHGKSALTWNAISTNLSGVLPWLAETGSSVSTLWGSTLFAVKGTATVAGSIGFLKYAAFAGALIAGGKTMKAISQLALPPFMKSGTTVDQAMANVIRYGGSLNVRDGELNVSKLGDKTKTTKKEVQNMKNEFKRTRREIMKESRLSMKDSLHHNKTKSQSIFDLIETAYDKANFSTAIKVTTSNTPYYSSAIGSASSFVGQAALLGMPKMTGYLYKKFV